MGLCDLYLNAHVGMVNVNVITMKIDLTFIQTQIDVNANGSYEIIFNSLTRD